MANYERIFAGYGLMTFGPDTRCPAGTWVKGVSYKSLAYDAEPVLIGVRLECFDRNGSYITSKELDELPNQGTWSQADKVIDLRSEFLTGMHFDEDPSNVSNIADGWTLQSDLSRPFHEITDLHLYPSNKPDRFVYTPVRTFLVPYPHVKNWGRYHSLTKFHFNMGFGAIIRNSVGTIGSDATIAYAKKALIGDSRGQRSGHRFDYVYIHIDPQIKNKNPMTASSPALLFFTTTKEKKIAQTTLGFFPAFIFSSTKCDASEALIGFSPRYFYPQSAAATPEGDAILRSEGNDQSQLGRVRRIVSFAAICDNIENILKIQSAEQNALQKAFQYQEAIKQYKQRAKIIEHQLLSWQKVYFDVTLTSNQLAEIIYAYDGNIYFDKFIRPTLENLYFEMTNHPLSESPLNRSQQSEVLPLKISQPQVFDKNSTSHIAAKNYILLLQELRTIRNELENISREIPDNLINEISSELVNLGKELDQTIIFHSNFEE